MNPNDPIQWLAKHGHSALRGLKVLSMRPLRVDWSGTRFADWQRVLLEEQLQLRQRSAARFPEPDRWLWTDRSLQQASDWQSAVMKASLFPSGSGIVDACCGAGVDLVALAQHHQVVGVDRDRSLLELARSNVNAHSMEAHYLQAELPAALAQLRHGCLHADPDRRRGQSRETRTTQADAFSPPLSEIMLMGEHARACLVKLAPATELELDDHSPWRRAWIGVGRECPQQLLMQGDLTWCVPAGQRGALLVENPHLAFSACPESTCATADEPSRFVFEPHAALYASGLAAAWAEQQDLCALPHSASYYTGESLVTTPWCQSFEVLAHFSWDQRRVRKWLKANRMGTVEVKTRQVPLDANQLQRELSSPDGDPVTCLLYRCGKSIRAIMARRMAA